MSKKLVSSIALVCVLTFANFTAHAAVGGSNPTPQVRAVGGSNPTPQVSAVGGSNPTPQATGSSSSTGSSTSLYQLLLSLLGIN